MQAKGYMRFASNKGKICLVVNAKNILRRLFTGGSRAALIRVNRILRLLAQGEWRRFIAIIASTQEAPASNNRGSRAVHHDLMPIRVVPAFSEKKRINIVTDSIGSASLFGGVATALICGSLMAKSMNASLRVITRTDPPTKSNLQKILKLHGVSFDNEVDFAYSGAGQESRPIDVGPGDIFLTTSWWTTYAAMKAINHSSIVYICQEDERTFYPSGDNYLQAQDVMRNHNIRFIVNSELLFRHLVADGFDNIEDRGVYFEPAFPCISPNSSRRSVHKEKKRLFFYARPGNPRNLYRRGIEVLSRCIASGVIDRDHWEIDFVGTGLTVPKEIEHVKVCLWDTVSWAKYSEIVSNSDLGLCLMATPHPSYPPLDLAAAGIPVVTNCWGIKQTLNNYSPIISCVDPSIDNLVDALRSAIGRSEPAGHTPVNDFLSRDWAKSLEKPLHKLMGGFDHV